MALGRIDPQLTTIEEAAALLIERLGRNRAVTEASRRYYRAKGEVTAGFYEQVLAEVLRIQRLDRFLWDPGDIRLDR